jgi:hypothetical protein
LNPAFSSDTGTPLMLYVHLSDPPLVNIFMRFKIKGCFNVQKWYFRKLLGTGSLFLSIDSKTWAILYVSVTSGTVLTLMLEGGCPTV